MVLPLEREHMPKCHVCHGMFGDMEQLRRHQEAEHGMRAQKPKEPAPGDVSVF